VLFGQFVRYRLRIAIERLAVLEQLLNGNEVFGWKPQSHSLGKNLEAIQYLIWHTSTQVDLPILYGTVSASSEVNAINLEMACSERVLYLYSFGLRSVRDSLMIGLHEQEVTGNFDRDLVQSIFSFADKILRQLM